MRLRHHALRQFPDLAGAPDGGVRKKTFRLRAVESRMHADEVVERLRNPQPAGEHGDIGNEGDIAHELMALGPGVASEPLEFSLIWGEADSRVERGSLSGAVGPDESEDTDLFDAQIDAVQRDGCAELGSPRASMTVMASAPSLHHSTMDGLRQPPAVHAASARAAEWLRKLWAIVPRETSDVRPAAADCASQC
jgi:hypothetical protein